MQTSKGGGEAQCGCQWAATLRRRVRQDLAEGRLEEHLHWLPFGKLNGFSALGTKVHRRESEWEEKGLRTHLLGVEGGCGVGKSRHQWSGIFGVSSILQSREDNNPNKTW